MAYSALFSDIIAHMMLQSWNHSVPFEKLTNLGGHDLTLRYSDPNMLTVYMCTATSLTLCYGWRVGIVQPECVTASAVDATAAPD